MTDDRYLVEYQNERGDLRSTLVEAPGPESAETHVTRVYRPLAIVSVTAESDLPREDYR